MAEDTTATSDSDRLSKVHREAMRRFDAAWEVQRDIRAHALECRRFIAVPGAMWEGPWGEMFADSIRVEIDFVTKGVRKIIGDYRANRIVPDFRPAGNKGDQETADTLDGLHRADSYHFKAQQARDNAFEEALAGGMGAYRLTNELSDPLDKDDDTQRINPGLLIADADQRVFFDPSSKLYDKSDAKWCIVLTGETREAFEDAYPGKAVSWPENTTRYTYDWFAPDMVIKAEYYVVEERREKLLIMTFPLTQEERRVWNSDIDAESLQGERDKGWTVREVMRDRRRVVKYVMSGAEVLKDHGPIAGSLIPVVPVYGERFYVDGVERFRGYVSKRMDSNRIYNAKVSKLSETDALAPREKPIFDPEQLPPELRTLWANQEKDRHPYALANALRNPDGSIASLGPIGMITPPQVSPVTALLLQAARQDLTDETADGADQVVANTSAEAMDIAATRIDARSELYLDNMRQSVQREGEVYLSMAAEVYHEEGREAETMTEDGDDGIAVLKEPYTDKSGAFGHRNDFGGGRYKCIADVTEATATRRDKTVKSALATASIAMEAGDQELAQAAILTAIQNQDGEGMDSLKSFARKKAVSMGLEKPNEEEQAAMEEQAQAPDPNAALAEAQGQALLAQAAKDAAQAEESESKIALNEARAMKEIATAAKARGEGLLSRFNPFGRRSA